VGKALLRDALERTLQAPTSPEFERRVHAKDEQARSFYARFDFVPSPTDSLHLFLLVKDVRHLVSDR